MAVEDAPPLTGDDEWKRVFDSADMGDPFTRACYEVLSKATPERRKKLIDGLAKADMISQRARDWVAQLVQIAKAIDDAGPTDNPWYLRELLWIRLHGTIFELPNYLQNIAARPDEVRPAPVRVAAKNALDATVRLRTAFSEPELVMLQWLRDRAAHVRAESYEIRWNKEKAKAKELKQIQGVAKTLTIADVDRCRHEILSAFGSDAAFAVKLVERLKPDLLALVNAVLQMSGTE